MGKRTCIEAVADNSTLAEQFQSEAHDFSFVPREYLASKQFVFDASVDIGQLNSGTH